MDEEARLYQDQLHRTNQERMERFEKKLDEVLDKVAPLKMLTRQWAALERRVDILEREQWFRKGVIATLTFLSSLAGAAFFHVFDVLMHRFMGK